MMRIKRTGLITILVVLLVGMSFSHGAEIEKKPVLHVQPNKIHIGSFFKGQKVKIFGYVPVSWENIAIKICGSRHDVALKRKGKVGVLWMNVGTVEVKHAPNFYLVATSANINQLAPKPILDQTEIGYEALAKEIELHSTVPGDSPEFLFKHFVALKEKEGLYSILPKRITFNKAENKNLKAFSLELIAPAKIPPGEYKVTLYGFDNGQLMGSLESFFHVELVGFPAFCRNLAFKHSLIYGILAVVLAIIVGFLMGVVFGSKGGH